MGFLPQLLTGRPKNRKRSKMGPFNQGEPQQHQLAHRAASAAANTVLCAHGTAAAQPGAKGASTPWLSPPHLLRANKASPKESNQWCSARMHSRWSTARGMEEIARRAGLRTRFGRKTEAARRQGVSHFGGEDAQSSGCPFLPAGAAHSLPPQLPGSELLPPLLIYPSDSGSALPLKLP